MNKPTTRNKPTPRNNNAVTAIIVGAILLISALAFKEADAINTDRFYSLLALSFMSLLVGAICFRPIANQNKNK